MSDRAKWGEERYLKAVSSVSSRLRTMADEIDSRVADKTTTAERVVHTVIWGIANSHLDVVVFAEGEWKDALQDEIQRKYTEASER